MVDLLTTNAAAPTAAVAIKDALSDVEGMSAIVAAHLEWMEAERYSRNTIKDRSGALRRADAALPRGLCDVYPQEIRTYLDQPSWSAWTVHTYHAHLAAFYAWGAAAGWLNCDPMADLRCPSGSAFLPRPLSAREVALALHRSPEPWYTCVILGVGAGLRASEMAGLRREDVTDEHVFIRRGKGGKPRYVPTCTTVWAHIAKFPPGPVVTRPTDGQPVNGAWLSACQRRHWVSVDLPQIHLHRLRHTFCSVMYDAGHDPLVLRDLMGHASVATTQGYALVSGRKRLQAVSAIDTLFGLIGTPAGV